MRLIRHFRPRSGASDRACVRAFPCQRLCVGMVKGPAEHAHAVIAQACVIASVSATARQGRECYPSKTGQAQYYVDTYMAMQLGRMNSRNERRWSATTGKLVPGLGLRLRLFQPSSRLHYRHGKLSPVSLPLSLGTCTLVSIPRHGAGPKQPVSVEVFGIQAQGRPHPS